MLKTVLLKSRGVLINGTGSILMVIIAFAILLVGGVLILTGFFLGIAGIVQLAIAIRDALPWTEGKAIILTLEGSWLNALLDLIAGSFISAIGGSIFHFLFPEKRKPRRLRRKRIRKEAHAARVIRFDS